MSAYMKLLIVAGVVPFILCFFGDRVVFFVFRRLDSGACKEGAAG